MIQRVVFLVFVALCVTGLIAPRVESAERKVDELRRVAIIDTVAARLRELYLYPDIAQRMEERIRSRSGAGSYDHIESLEVFVARLTEDLLSVFPDGHLEIGVLREDPRGEGAAEDWWEEQVESSRFNNFGLWKVERLPGNIGYLDLRKFDYPSIAGEPVTAAMKFLAHADALIIDLRRNPGGRGELSQLLLSYFFEDHRVHFLTEQDGVRKLTKQWWTVPYVPGRRKPDVPLYVLTSPSTGSAAEEFAFVLQNLGRATIVGGTTAGAAHKTHVHTYPDLCIEIHMPDGRSYDPRTRHDWEGDGVAPDVVVSPQDALEIAHADALERLLASETDPGRRFRLEWVERELNAKRNPIHLSDDEMRRYVGVYGPRRISVDAGLLYYEREQRPRHRLVPLGEDWFLLDGLDYFRIRFGRDESGSVTQLIGIYDDGSESRSPRARN
jgi:hypothetical protein